MEGRVETDVTAAWSPSASTSVAVRPRAPQEGAGNGSGGPARGTVTVDIDSLKLDGSPRLEGENVVHTRTLAATDSELPPVLVHRQTMRVIDGVHRVQAARLRGERTIRAVLFEGDARSAFVHAVQTNIAHGLPLSLADRVAAAEQIVVTHPEWSDRAVAAATGLSSARVRAVRERVTDEPTQSSARVGRDGRVRPLDIADGRRRAAEVIQGRPEASLREVARASGVSVGTARDVRRRLHNGLDPVPDGRRQRSVRHQPAAGGTATAGSGKLNGSRLPSSILDGLKTDPSLRYSEQGRNLVRWLDAHFVDTTDCARIADHVPAHCTYTISELALAYANAWRSFAVELAARARAKG
jgi:ParB-like chromosome segregation protein Spo0J